MLSYSKTLRLIQYEKSKILEFQGNNNYFSVKVFYGFLLLSGLVLCFLIGNSKVGGVIKGFVWIVIVGPILGISINKLFDGVNRSLFLTTIRFDESGITYNHNENNDAEKHVSKDDIQIVRIVKFGRFTSDTFFRIYLKSINKPAMEFTFHAENRLPKDLLIEELIKILKFKYVKQHEIDSDRIYYELRELDKYDMITEKDFVEKQVDKALEITPANSSFHYLKIDFESRTLTYKNDHFLINTIQLVEIEKFYFTTNIEQKPQEMNANIVIETRSDKSVKILTNTIRLNTRYTDIIEYEKFIQLQNLSSQLNNILMDFNAN